MKSVAASGNDLGPLCARLGEGDSISRKTVVKALADLGTPAALECLRAAHDPDPQVQFWIDEVVWKLSSAIEVQAFSDFAELEPIAEGEVLSTQQAALAAELVRQSLARHRIGMRAAVDRPSQPGVDAGGPPAHHRLRLTVSLIDDQSMRAELVVMRLPTQRLVGSWIVRASGGKVESKLKAIVPRVVDDALRDLGLPSTGTP